MSLKRRVRALEGKISLGYVTLTLKDGSSCRVRDHQLWATFFQISKSWSRCVQSAPSGQQYLGSVPQQVLDDIPLLRTILDMVADDADGQAVNLIQAVCAVPSSMGAG